MKIKQIAGILALLAVLVIGGCASHGSTGYSTYNDQPQQQYVGGGCGVLPLVHYEDSVIKTANEWGIVL